MEQNEKPCPYCAEPIKAEAIKCRHCGSDLRAQAEKEGKKRSSGLWLAIKIAAAGGAAFMAYGFYLSSTPEGEARGRLRNAIDLCRSQERSFVGSVGAREVISGACEKLEDDLRNKRYSTAGEPRAATPPVEPEKPGPKPIGLVVGQRSQPASADVRLLSGPEFGGQKVGTLQVGDVAIVAEYRDGWARVTTEDGRAGWVVPEMLNW